MLVPFNMCEHGNVVTYNVMNIIAPPPLLPQVSSLALAFGWYTGDRDTWTMNMEALGRSYLGPSGQPLLRWIISHHDNSQYLVGHISQHWVFFWYNATYFWTLFFAVDVYNTKHGGKWKLGCSHFFTWFFCFVYITGSLCSLWTCPPYLEWVWLHVTIAFEVL